MSAALSDTRNITHLKPILASSIILPSNPREESSKTSKSRKGLSGLAAATLLPPYFFGKNQRHFLWPMLAATDTIRLDLVTVANKAITLFREKLEYGHDVTRRFWYVNRMPTIASMQAKESREERSSRYHHVIHDPLAFLLCFEEYMCGRSDESSVLLE